MNVKIWIGTLTIGLLLIAGLWKASGDDDGWWDRSGERENYAGVEPANDVLYVRECGSCHFAFQPGLLPSRSWEKIMGSLSDHFGENAEPVPEDAKALTDYLMSHAADRSSHRRSVKIMRSVRDGQAPIRITQLPYIVRKHHEIPGRFIQGNPDVKTLSRCNACHTRAESGIYTEEEVSIPGFGRWED